MAVTFYNTGEERLRAGALDVIHPEIIEGWWSDELDHPIKKALLSDMVRFHIQTKGISDGSQVAITIMDDDGPFNPDDKILSASVTINADRGYADIKLERSWLRLIDSDSGDEIELYADCKYQNISKELPASSDSYLSVYSVGYIAYNDCRVKVCDNGDIEFWPEHFGRLARGQWNNANYPYRQGTAVYTDPQGNQYIGGIPTKLNRIVNPDDVLPLDYQKYGQNLRERDLPEIEDNTPASPVNNRPTRKQKSIAKRGGGVARPPAGAKAGAWITLGLDVAIMIHDIMLPLAVNEENNMINQHHHILVKNVMKDIVNASRQGIINEELTFKECCQLLSVVLYGGDAHVSDKVYRIGCDVYKFVSEFEKITL